MGVAFFFPPAAEFCRNSVIFLELFGWSFIEANFFFKGGVTFELLRFLLFFCWNFWSSIGSELLTFLEGYNLPFSSSISGTLFLIGELKLLYSILFSSRSLICYLETPLILASKNITRSWSSGETSFTMFIYLRGKNIKKNRL